MKTTLIAGLAALATLGAVGAAVAQPPPRGWVGPHYFWHGHHYHHRAWVRATRTWRYY